MSTLKMADDLEENVNYTKNTNEESLSNGKKRKLSKEEKKMMKEKKAKVSVRRKPGFDKELYDETSYYIKDGLRHVVPYYFTFTSHCKGRWIGRKILDVFKEEFRSEPPEYYEKAIQSGKITVNGELATSQTILKDNEVICHRVHRHEPPVTAAAIQIVESNQDVVVINKPSSIPVHPCGRYRHNSVVFLLGKEHGLSNLFTVHRIDRLTSGILMFAKTLKKAQELEEQVRERQIEKEYVCRVKGEFPDESVECNEPILVVSHKVGVCRVSNEGKPCKTIFTKLHGNKHSSVVKCKPFTGRMHQIRVHLQWLGYPIIDDPIYNSPAWGETRGKGGVTDDEALKVIKFLAEYSATIVHTTKTAIPSQIKHTHTDTDDNLLTETTNREQHPITPETLNNQKEQDDPQETCTTNCRYCTQEKTTTNESKQQTSMLNTNKETLTQRDDFIKDEDCSECKLTRRNPTPAELTMCLHALSYKGPDWEYKTETPSWAEHDK